MRKTLLIFIIINLIIIPVSAVNLTLYPSNISPQQDLGTVKLDFNSYGNKYLKSIIEKDGEEYIYNIISDIELFPLQMGNGEYNITILGSSDGRRFKVLSKNIITVTLETNIVFLSTHQIVSWNDESEVTIFAKQLVEGLESDREKFEVIHNYIINNVSYDYEKASSLPRGYIPNPDSTLEENLGICYDFASLTASMLRAVDIPVKLVKGYSTYTPVYHAWNEVLLDDTWIVIDASTDSIFINANVNIVIEKSTSSYLPSKIY